MRALRLMGAVAVALLLGSCPGLLSLVATQGATGRESGFVLLAVFGLGWAVAYGLGTMAAFTIIHEDAPREAVVKAVVCGAAGGAASGLLVAWLFLTHNLGGSAQAVYLDFGIVLFLPWLLGWVVWNVWRR